MAVVTLGSLITRVKDRSNTKFSQFVTDTELTALINEGVSELNDLLITAYGEDYFASSVTFTSQANVENYSLSTITGGQFYKLLGLDVSQGGRYQNCTSYNFNDRNQFTGSAYNYVPGLPGASSQFYRVTGSNLSLKPVPPSGTSFQMHYVPVTTPLSLTTDSFNGQNGWEEFIVITTAIKVKDKEGSDVSVLMASLGASKQRIIGAAPARDAGAPKTMVDTGNDAYPFGYGWGNY